MSESDDRWRRIDEVFSLAVEKPPEERAAVLEKACGTDPDLRREVERLLEGDERARGFLETPAGRLWLDETATVESDPSEGACADLLAVGHVLAGRYRILSLVGKGGMGAVYRAYDTSLSSEVAVKVLDRQRTRDAAKIEAFRREVKLARRVSHPNVCRVHDIGEADGSVFLTMEYVEGESLARRLQRGALDLASCERVLRDVTRGLAAAHTAGVVHRDLKPENVLLRSGTDEGIVADFGIAAQFEDDERAGWIVGTRGYMSPEQLEGKPVDSRSDVYALGVLIHQMATGRLPDACRDTATSDRFDEETSPSMPLALKRLVAACLRIDPAERPEDAAAALALFEAASSMRPGDGRRAPRTRKRSILVRTALTALMLLVAGAGLWRMRSWPPEAPTHFAVGPINASALGDEEAPTSDALRSLIRNELLDAWGLTATLWEAPSRFRETARVEGRVWRDEGIVQLLLRIQRGWTSREYRASGRSLRELAENAAAQVVEASVPSTKRRPTPDDLRAVGTRDAEAWRLLQRARRSARMQRWGEARQRLHAATERDPKFALAWIELAMTYNDDDTALHAPLARGLELAEHAFGLDTFSSAILDFARYWRENDFDGQARVMQSLTRLSLTDEDRLYGGMRVALALFVRGDPVNGMARMEWIIETWPEDAGAVKFLADYHLAANELGHLPADHGVSLALALRYARKAVALAPEDMGARVYLAQALMLSGDREGARRQNDLLKRMEYEEKQSTVSMFENINNLFALHMALGEWDEAGIDARRMLMSTSGRRVGAQLALGLLDLNQGAHDEGLDKLSRVVAERTQNGMASLASEDAWELCLHAFRLGRYARARDACGSCRRLCQASPIRENARRSAAASVLERIAAARILDEPARSRALAQLRSSFEGLPADLAERLQLSLLCRYAAQDWAGVVKLYKQVEGRPEAITVAIYAADALDRLGRQEEARRVDEWFTSQPNAWRYPNLRVRLGEPRRGDQS
jgi:serine/threonine protein kinase/tetratricopeptide (TPR) repeat protein